MKLVIASKNFHKIREFRSILGEAIDWDILSLIDYPDVSSPEETASSFTGNALIKAEHATKYLDAWSIADDSGLVVPALKGAPGVFSARYAGSTASDVENRNKLIKNMNGLRDDSRAAYFECAIVLTSPKGYQKTVVGTCEGTIIEEERGSNGFGYDPLFLKYGYTKTFGELDEATKNRVSHRRKAIDKLLLVLEGLKESKN